MALTPRPSSGSQLYVSAAAPATVDEAGYAALTWTEVAGFDNLGEIGDEYEVGTFDSLTEGRIKYRSILDAGQIDATPLDAPDDPGQIILKAAFGAAKGSAAETISIKIEDESGVGTYARAIVSTWKRLYGGAADLQLRKCAMPIVAGTVVEY